MEESKGVHNGEDEASIYVEFKSEVVRLVSVSHKPISEIARELGVSRSGYYAWRDREASDIEMANLELTERIRAIHTESRGTYGYPRPTALIDLD